MREVVQRRLALEPFEERTLMSVNGPVLLAVIPATGTVIETNTVLKVPPRELLLRFDEPIDSTTLTPSGLPTIQLLRSGDNHPNDRKFGNGNDVPIVPGYMALGENPFDVVVRFTDNLPDDLYQLTIVGAGAAPLRDIQGRAFNNGANLVRPFTLDLGAQVEAIVPQPVTRNAQGQLVQAVNQIDVYFNVNDPLEVSSAQNRFFYQLIRTGGTATTQDDVRVHPASVTYSQATGKATLTFNAGDLTAAGTYRLRIGTNEPLALTPSTPALSRVPGDTFDTAAAMGTGGVPFTNASGSQTIEVADTITNVALDALSPGSPVLFPGAPFEPGERPALIETRVDDTTNTGAIPTISYNFQHQYGFVLGQPAFNTITETQKQRVREVFSYYAYYLGVQFVETASAGYTIATGDVRAVDRDAPPTGVAGIAGRNVLDKFTGVAVMNALIDWGGSEPGGNYFQTAMHEVGHLLGLGHDYAAPAITVQGAGGESSLGGSLTAGEPVFPGDLDLIYARYLWPGVGNDINVYRFEITHEDGGKLSLETIAERMNTLNLGTNPSQLNTVISLYDANRNLIARNDDYYGKDSFLELQVAKGIYYVAITSTGNTEFDPNVANSGANGTSQGAFRLRLSFVPTVAAQDSLRDVTGTKLDGDRDGVEGGVNDFWFKVDASRTLFVDKAATGGTGALGSLTNPYTTIVSALAVATPGSIVRIVGNGGADRDLATVGDNLSYNVGFDSLNRPLSDGSSFNVPRGVTVMIDAGAIIKLRGANIDAGSSAPGVDRSAGAVQVLGTTAKDALGRDVGSVYFTSYYNNAIGFDAGTAKGALTKGDWGGLVFRNDSDLESAGIFLNYVNHANLSWGGGQVTVNSVRSVYAPIHLETARPTVTYNTITSSADSAISGDPDSFEETGVLGPGYHAEYTRVGPRIYGNTLQQNSINGLFIRIRTLNGSPLDPLRVNARFASTDIVHVLNEVLQIRSQPGEFLQVGTQNAARPNARLAIDPGIILKLDGGRIETQLGAQFIAEGTVDRPIIVTSGFDDRYGAGSTFDTTNDGLVMTPAVGDWGGLYFAAASKASLDYVYLAFGGGTSTVEGGFDVFNPVEINQAKVRITNSVFEANALGGGGERNGRSPSDESVIFIRGAQPVLLNNTIRNNVGRAISINVNALNAEFIDDWGRSRGRINRLGSFSANTGPLIDNNVLGNNGLNGMRVRGGTLTTNVIWDDTDIVHVVEQPIQASNQQSLTGTLRLESSSSESLVVKMFGTNTDLIAGGEYLDTTDRLGGTLQVVGMPNHPVVITSLRDDSVGAGLNPQGLPQKDTLNRKGFIPSPVADLETQGPMILHSAPLEEHGTIGTTTGVAGWAALRQLVDYLMNESRAPNPTNDDTFLVVGLHDLENTGRTYSQAAFEQVADDLGLNVDFVQTTNEINGVNFNNYRAVIIASDAQTPMPTVLADAFQEISVFGGVTNAMLAALANRRGALIDYVNQGGGGLLVLSQNTAAAPYAFLADPDVGLDPLVIRKSGGNTLTFTEHTPPEFLNYGATQGNLNAGLPWLYAFEGTAGFNRLQPFMVDPITGEIGMLGLAPGGPGFGPAQGVSDQLRRLAAAGDWGTLRLDALSNDRNVEIINEFEQRFSPAGDTNHLPSTAQFLGELAKDQLSGDDNVRLGFEIHGNISQTTFSQGGGDVDVYSFRGTAGTMVWIDIDRTSPSLDTIVELVDANGAVVARSNNSQAEGNGNAPLTGSALPLQLGGVPGAPSAFAQRDFYTTNPKDAGMRVVLPPGPEGPVNTYFVRVRSNTSSASNLANLTGGVTKGSYVMQLRLQELDEFPGSTVRYADIRYATNGIEVIGKPENSPLLTGVGERPFLGFDPETGEPIDNTSFLFPQDIGNLMASDQFSLAVAGSLSSPTDVDWYRFEMSMDQIQSVGGLTDQLRTFAATLRINYADGLSRPDTTISLYDATGRLLYVARDSQVVDALPRPTMGSDTTNLSHGSYGVLDPTLGPVQLPTGTPGPFGTVTYYVAVSSGTQLPAALSASFAAGVSTNPLVRLEPADGFLRITEDHLGVPNLSTGAPAPQLFPGATGTQLNAFVDPYQLGDVVLFVNTQDGDRHSQLRLVNPFTGEVLNSGTNIRDLQLPTQDNGDDNRLGFYDIAMRNDGRLFAFTQGSSDDTSGNYIEFNTATGQIINADPGSPLDDGLKTYTLSSQSDPFAAIPNLIWDDNLRGIQFEALTFFQSPDSTDRRLFAIGNRAPGDDGSNNSDVPVLPQITNILFEFDPDTGAVIRRMPIGWNVWRQDELIGTGTDAQPVTVFDQVNGRVTGIAIVGDQFFMVTNTGNLYRATGIVGQASVPTHFHLNVKGEIPVNNVVDDDYYYIGDLQAGDVITVQMSGAASNRGTLTDPYLELHRQGISGALVADDNSGPGNDALLTFTVTESDRYFIKAENRNNATGTYELGVWLQNSGPLPVYDLVDDTKFESENNNSKVLPPGANSADDLSTSWKSVQYRSDTNGTISTPLDVDRYQFNFNTDDIVTVNVDSTSGLNAAVRVFREGVTSQIAAIRDNDSLSNIVDADPGSGGRILLQTQTPHLLSDGQTVTVANVQGTVEANGTWVIDVIDPLRFELIGSSFQNEYVRGGTVSFNGDRIRITTLGLHSFGDGDQVFLSGVNIPNGGVDINSLSPWTIDVVDGTRFDLVGSESLSWQVPGGTYSGGAATLPGSIIATDNGSAEGHGDPNDAIAYSFRAPGRGTYYVDVSSASGAGSYTSTVFLSSIFAPPPPGGTLPNESEPNDPPEADDASSNFFRTFGVGVERIGTSGNNYRGLTAGPINVENGRYANILFAVDASGNLHALNSQTGGPAGVFLDGRSSINTGVGNLAHGLAFSTLDYNLWHTTLNRATQSGHGVGIAPSLNDVRIPAPESQNQDLIGGASFYFGLDPRSNDGRIPSQPGVRAYESNPTMFGTYGMPGGALGSITTNSFSLEGYSPYDLPTLYFNYFLDTGDVDSSAAFPGLTGPRGAQDVFRVMASTDGVNWHMLASSNTTLGSEFTDTPRVITPNGGLYQGMAAEQRIQGLHEADANADPEEPGEPIWRQARVDLSDFAGQSNLRLRFQFTTSGSMGTDLGVTNGLGQLLQAVPGWQLRDEDTFSVDGQTFRFRSGFSLNVPTGGGSLIADGETLTINGIVYEFDKNGSVSGSNRPIAISSQQSAEAVAQTIFAVLIQAPNALPDTRQFGARVEIPDALTISQSPIHAMIVSGSALPAVLPPGQIRVHLGMSAEEVAVRIARELDRVFTVGINDAADPDLFTSSKVEKDRLRVFGHFVTDAGPLAAATTLMPGDLRGVFNSSVARDRHQGTFEGVYIDDIIVGLASRGEMVTNATEGDVEFVTIPEVRNAPARVLAGPYQLQINPSDAYGSIYEEDELHRNQGHILLDRSFHVNDRFGKGYSIIAPSGASVVDGRTFIIDDGAQRLTFEFDTNQTLVNPSRIRVAVPSGGSAADVADAITNAVNNAVATRGFKVRAGTVRNIAGQTTGGRVDLFGALDVSDAGGTLQLLLYGVDRPDAVTKTGKGDINGLFGNGRVSTAPGQTIIHNNTISDSQQVGIQVVPKIGQVFDTLFDGTAISTFPLGLPGQTGSPANLPTINTRAWVPGVTIKNNLVVETGRTGIQIGGNPNADRAYAQRGLNFVDFGEPHFRPFVRVLNNTVFGAKNGIAAVNASSATIINNVIANTGVALTDIIRTQGAAIIVDGSSGPPIQGVRYGDSEIGTNVYQNNAINVLGAGDSRSIALTPNEPLFVDAANRNFYLAPLSRAIDSSINSVQERPELAAASLELGIPHSPIQAPDRDLLGQLRVDDPLVNSPPGLGSNIFKDRGAIERADVTGPTAVLINPLDNDSAAKDRNLNPNEVVLVNEELRDITIQLLDGAGVGIDDNSVDITKFVIEQTIGGSTRVLTPNVDYALAYDTNAKTAKFVPAQNIWAMATYKITLNTTTAPIRDLAGNALQPNVFPSEGAPASQFTVQLTDVIASRWQNAPPGLRQDVNNSGTVTGLDLLLIINRILEGMGGTLPLTGPVPWFVDTNGDGRLTPADCLQVINYINQQLATPKTEGMTSLAEEGQADAQTVVAAPAAAPAVAPDKVAAGLAMSKSSIEGGQTQSEPWHVVHTGDETEAAVVPSAAPLLEAPASATAEDRDEYDPLDDELDSILADLIGDLR